ncbi:MAG: SIMPL domain-containing protein [Erysipelotrichaceae bacterium]
MERKITITASSSTSIKADVVEFDITLSSLDQSYQKAYTLSTEQLAQLQFDLTSIGIKKEQLKTTSFDVQQKFNNIRNQDGSYSRQLEGYQITHCLVLQQNYDIELLAAVLNKLAFCSCQPQFNIRFTCKNQKDYTELLMKQLTKEAKHRARLLAKDNGVKLKQLVDVDYSFSDGDYYSPTVYGLCKSAKMDGGVLELNPQDITISASARFIWEIE